MPTHDTVYLYYYNVIHDLLPSFGPDALAKLIKDSTPDFRDKMNSHDIAKSLKVMDYISPEAEHDISHAKSRVGSNDCLLEYLQENQDDMEKVKGIFKIAAEKPGYGKMNKFAAGMLDKLEELQ